MRQPTILALAMVTIGAVFLTGIVLMKACNDELTFNEYSSFHRPPPGVVVAKETTTDAELSEMWDSVGWLGHEVEVDDKVIAHSYVETAWAVGSDKTFTYFLTCFHGPLLTGSENLVIGYWHQNDWHFAKAQMTGYLSKYGGDLALITVKTSDLHRQIHPLKVAKEQTFSPGDEVLIGGVQHYGGPAYVTVGIVRMINMAKPEFVVRGWAWYGFSGGPIRLRKTGEVIGFVRAATADHVNDAMESICGDYNVIIKLLKQQGLESLVK